jgi:hypothetical protein
LTTLDPTRSLAAGHARGLFGFEAIVDPPQAFLRKFPLRALLGRCNQSELPFMWSYGVHPRERAPDYRVVARRLDAFINPLAYTFWHNQCTLSIMTAAPAE